LSLQKAVPSKIPKDNFVSTQFLKGSSFSLGRFSLSLILLNLISHLAS
jgi:hypothetical protein